ncbi:hypothetical protein CALCODRAFT_489575 [Calocera cornea HHB12733]|uniref:Uncharacterized protein n=1 Tax=Calocera cornea HHB12733 TaxID=1353952 RepID=A0A165K2T8_9BASI|nr:hypothetical protein CALCODRAFT_489575 [Calocera cornea HHB12733]
MPSPVAPSPLDSLHLSLGAALPRIRQRRASSYQSQSQSTSSSTPTPTRPSIRSPSTYDLHRPSSSRTTSTPILPHSRTLTDPSLPLPGPGLYAHPGASLRPTPVRLHPLALAHMSRIAESAELLMRHLHATLAKRASARGAKRAQEAVVQDADVDVDVDEAGEGGTLKLDLGPAEDELVDVDVHLDRARLLKGLASFRANVNGLKRARHLGAAKRGNVHAVGPRRVFGAGQGKAAAWRARRGAVVSLGGEGLWEVGRERTAEREREGREAWVEDLREERGGEMDVEELGERMGDVRLHD